jgi:hypothetical protein
MSWDIFVQDFPRAARSVADIPDSFVPAPIGRRAEIIEKILEIVPIADFSDPAWGIIDGGDWSIEVNIGADETCSGLALHVRGGDAAVGVVALILDRLGHRAIDSHSGEFFVAGPTAIESFRQWREYRDQVVASNRGQ